jgi:hypothetical protein
MAFRSEKLHLILVRLGHVSSIVSMLAQTVNTWFKKRNDDEEFLKHQKYMKTLNDATEKGLHNTMLQEENNNLKGEIKT